MGNLSPEDQGRHRRACALPLLFYTLHALQWERNGEGRSGHGKSLTVGSGATPEGLRPMPPTLEYVVPKTEFFGALAQILR